MNGKALQERINELRARDPRVGITLNRERTAVTLLRGDLAPPVKAAELKESPYGDGRRLYRARRDHVASREWSANRSGYRGQV